MDVTLIANGLDLHGKLSTYDITQEITYKRIVTTLDGTEHPFGRVDKPVLTFSLFPMTDDESAEVYKALSDVIFQVTYTDTHQNAEQTKTMRMMTDISSTFALKSIDGKRRYKGGEIQLKGL